MLPVQFAFPLALGGFILIVPVLILYLLKPKPKHIRFPSVMFILNAEKAKRFRTFLKKIIRDPLLVIQILLICLLVSMFAQPFIYAMEEENVKETAVIVLDSSASMRSNDVSPDRFARAKALAGGIIRKMNDESRVSIVLAENVPIILAKGAKKQDALAALDSAFCGDTPSSVPDAVVFAKDMFLESDVNRKIYVLSDFAHIEGSELPLVEKIALQKNVSVSFLRVTAEGGNVGIIDVKAKRFLTDRNRFYLTYTVRNYLKDQKDVEAEVLLDGRSVASLRGTVPSGGERLWSYEGSLSEDAHRIEVRLKDADNLIVDDSAYVFLPKVRKYKVLLISDEGADQYLRYALESSKDIELRVSVLPVIPEFSGFDVVIVGSLKKDFILPGMFRDLSIYANDGGHVVYVAAPWIADYRSAELDSSLPLVLDSLREKQSEISVDIDHEILSDIVPRGALVFPNIAVDKYIRAQNKSGSVVIAEASGSPIIAYNISGRGKFVFVGINPSPGWSNFYYSSTFPVFWLQLITWVAREESLLGINNFRTGDYMPVASDSQVVTPSGGSSSAGSLILDETGFYSVRRMNLSDTVAVSLLSDEESDISSRSTVKALDDRDFSEKRTSIEVRKDLIPYLCALAAGLLVFEAYYYRRRALI